ncbi:ABC-2 type transport system ATP-binding protein [Jatrophihabitans endophyticus]|uniref:ABC-2 type transport system ATP-binding protein n=1 Tax=Jatrophihabitans endophyticus TaxID=1206085 RepID=A0A1M5T3X8_9ACTN|nr:ABC transporter ATP-binding protein [Jatrophihabitans endophyticus]SHH45406.1 ABC-2 type transport system ATP-binding protein [Jatrophihabitans endophyticus]
MIETRGLTKLFGRVRAVDDIALDVRAGDVYGFLGANGSGKTTTVRMLLGLVLPTSGELRLFGEPMPRAARRVLPRVGTLVEGPAAYGHLPARANLALIDAAGPGGRAARRTRDDRVAAALDQVGLGGIGRRPVKAFSLGMRQRLGIAAALLRSPELLILDEPTNGLDPQGIHEMRELLLALNAAGTTVFVSSHLLAEIEQLCTRVGVLDRGRLVVQDSLSALRRPTGLVEVRTAAAEDAARDLGDRVERRDGDTLWVRADDAAELNARLVAAGVPVTGLVVQHHTLEEVVLQRSGGSADRVPARTAP